MTTPPKDWLASDRDAENKKTDPERLELRDALRSFANDMERKLRKNDHKTSWRMLPIRALMRLMEIEIEEFKVAIEYMTVEEARKELVDVANFAMILSDRLSLEQQSEKVKHA